MQEDKKDKIKVLKHIRGKKGGVAMKQDQGINPLVGAAVGAAVGSVMGAAAAVALSDKNTREKVKEVATSLRDQAAERIEDLTEKAGQKAKVAGKGFEHRLEDPK